MSNEQSDSTAKKPGEKSPGFFKRYRLPLSLAAIALCLYVGSIIYILYGRGQVA